ncbi:MAG TPA: hypothetical protein PK281_10650, partial [Flavobacteriales bacterium]|nr:hypothetical protein [Flavobacteriales bacterium]
AIDFITSTMDAMPPLYKVNFGTSKGLLEDIMYLSEFRLTINGWIYFGPIDFDRFTLGGESRIPIPEILIDDNFIDRVLSAVFDGIERNSITSLE